MEDETLYISDFKSGWDPGLVDFSTAFRPCVVDLAREEVIDFRTPPRIVGVDLASGPSRTSHYLRSGAQFVCAVPRELGAVTKMEIISGRVVAHTESGIDMIVPRASGSRPR